MKKFLIIGMLSLALAGCQTTGQEVNNTISEVREQTKLVCSFVPTVETVAKIIATLVGGISTVNVVGAAVQGICDAVTNVPLSDGPGDHKPRFNDIIIVGKFVK